MIKALAIAAFIAITMTSCSQEYISVQNQSIYSDHLASVNIDTPDPRKKDPSIGERLIIRWHMPASVFHRYDEKMILVQTIRFGNMDTEIKSYPIEKPYGTVIYTLIDDEYFEKEGIATYKFEPGANGEIIEQWKHQVWVNYIDIVVDDELSAQ